MLFAEYSNIHFEQTIELNGILWKIFWSDKLYLSIYFVWISLLFLFCCIQYMLKFLKLSWT